MKFSNFSVQNALFQRRKRRKKPRDAAKKSQGSNCWRFSFQVGIAFGWELLTSACDILCQKQRYTDPPAEGMMKPGFFEAHYSEPTVLDALVCGSHIWSVAWFIQMKIKWSTGVKWTKERCLLSPTGECLRFSDPILYLTWCHYIGTAIPYIPCYTISYWSHILFLPSTGCNQWAQRQLPHLSAILGNLDPKFPRGFCATKRQIYEKPLKNCREHKTQVKHRST